jgi:hypothetical protein
MAPPPQASMAPPPQSSMAPPPQASMAPPPQSSMAPPPQRRSEFCRDETSATRRKETNRVKIQDAISGF